MNKITSEQHEEMLKKMDKEITKKRKEMKALPTLQAKIDASRAVKKAEQSRHAHKMSYFDLVDVDAEYAASQVRAINRLAIS